jgi:AAA ATPase-like protein
MQALLLLKQTVALAQSGPGEGTLRLGGPHVEFTDPEQILFYSPATGPVNELAFALSLPSRDRVEVSLERSGLDLRTTQAIYTTGTGQSITLGRQSLPEDIAKHPWFEPLKSYPRPVELSWMGCLPTVTAKGFLPAFFGTGPLWALVQTLTLLWHLPGHRGNPLRTYPRVPTSPLFHERAAGMIAQWSQKNAPQDARANLDRLKEELVRLGLTWKVETRTIDAANIELRVGRTPQAVVGGAQDLVPITDVGFGVSQCLPVLVALVAARAGQIVYVEQPEIHLHPRAQQAMADLIADTVRRGVQVVVETHSEIVLTRLQWHVARLESPLPRGDIIAHWFERDAATGVSKVTHATPDESGALGDWPVDFAEIAGDVDREYTAAAYARLAAVAREDES